MPAESEAQRRAAGAALSAKRKGSPSNLKGASKDMYEDMSEDDLEDFASKSNEDSLIKSIDDYIEKWGEGGYEDYGGYYYSPPPTPPAPAAPQPTATVTNSSPSDPPGASYTAPVTQSNASPPGVNTGGDPYPASSSSSSSSSSYSPSSEASYDAGQSSGYSSTTSVSSETSTSSNPSFSTSDAGNYNWDVDPGTEPVSSASTGANIDYSQEINDGSSYNSGASSAGVSTASTNPGETDEMGEWDNFGEGSAQGTSNSDFTSPTGAADTTNSSNPLAGTTGSFGIEPGEYNSGANQTIVPSGPGTASNETTYDHDSSIDPTDQASTTTTTREGDSRMGMDEGWPDPHNPEFGGNWQNQPITEPTDPNNYMNDPIVDPGTAPVATGGGTDDDKNKGGGGSGGGGTGGSGGGGNDEGGGGTDDGGGSWWRNVGRFIPGAANWVTDKVGAGWGNISDKKWVEWAQGVPGDVYDHVTSGFVHIDTGDGKGPYKGVEGEGFTGNYTHDQLASAPSWDSGVDFGGSGSGSGEGSYDTADPDSYYLANNKKTSDNAENDSIREISRYLERYG